MTEFDSKYANAQIYWIHCRDANINQFYVGSTCNFYNRRNKHINCCNNINNPLYNKSLYNYIRENGGWNNFRMDTIEPYPCDSKLELLINEQEWINILEPKLNKSRAYRTYDEHKEQMKNFQKINKKDLQQYRNKVIKCSNCDKTFTFVNKNQHLRTEYCKNYKSTASESFIESDTDVE